MKRKLLVAGPVALVIAIAAVAFFRPPAPGPRPPIKTNDPWVLQSNDPNDAYGTYLGNGCLGVRIGPEGTGARGPCLMAGLYEGESMLPLPNWADFPLYDGKGRKFVLDTKAPYRQTLNMREGYVETELTLKAGWQRLRGKVTFFIALRKPTFSTQIAAIRYELRPRWSGDIRLKQGLTPGQEWSKVLHLSNRGGISEFIGVGNHGDASAVVYARCLDGTGKLVKGPVRIRRGQRLTLTKFVYVCDSSGAVPTAVRYGPRHVAAMSAGDVLDATKWAATAIERRGFDTEFDASKKAWRGQWKSDIVIDGDPEVQRAINAMMFYLLSSANSEWSIPPTGLSLDAWHGHVFWDADIWMFPSLLLQNPDHARSVVDYRYKTLPGARENARKRGLAGAEFAWESARTGLETAPHPYSEERHVVSDVAFAQWQYFTATQDMQWLKDNGWPVVKSCADYWASRVVYNKVKDKYEILNVVPPDEDAEIVSNSVYTNVGAKRTLEIAMEMAAKLGQPYPPKWEEIARKMYIPFDEKNRRFIEYDGFKSKKTKQADTELLIYPLMHPMPDDVKRSTFDFYKAKTDPRGPAMTSSIHAIIAAELSRPDEAYDHFIESYRDFLRGPFLMFNEKRSKTYDNMCFLTGCGGTLQSVIYGFAGLRIGKQPPGFKQLLPDLYIKPCLPRKWKKLQIRNLTWRGKSYDLTILPGNKWKIEGNGAPPTPGSVRQQASPQPRTKTDSGSPTHDSERSASMRPR